MVKYSRESAQLKVYAQIGRQTPKKGDVGETKLGNEAESNVTGYHGYYI